jgi:hypothetical protein
MDSFFTLFSFTSTQEENPDASLPTNEESGGGSGGGAYCVIA